MDYGLWIESLVEVHDRGHWVADIDVLGQLRNGLFGRVSCICQEERLGASTRFPDNSPFGQGLIAADNWEELLDRENMEIVVRAHRNWQARLATAAVSVRHGYPTWVLPDTVCWGCACCHGSAKRSLLYVVVVRHDAISSHHSSLLHLPWCSGYGARRDSFHVFKNAWTIMII